jgi:hypothetical protein
LGAYLFGYDASRLLTTVAGVPHQHLGRPQRHPLILALGQSLKPAYGGDFGLARDLRTCTLVFGGERRVGGGGAS